LRFILHLAKICCYRGRATRIPDQDVLKENSGGAAALGEILKRYGKTDGDGSELASRVRCGEIFFFAPPLFPLTFYLLHCTR